MYLCAGHIFHLIYKLKPDKKAGLCSEFAFALKGTPHSRTLNPRPWGIFKCWFLYEPGPLSLVSDSRNVFIGYVRRDICRININEIKDRPEDGTFFCQGNKSTRKTNEPTIAFCPARSTGQANSKEIDQKVLVTEIAQIFFGLNALGSGSHVCVCVYESECVRGWGCRWVLSVTVCDYGHFNWKPDKNKMPRTQNSALMERIELYITTSVHCKNIDLIRYI